jgi:hypothetical protein
MIFFLGSNFFLSFFLKSSVMENLVEFYKKNSKISYIFTIKRTQYKMDF